MSEIERLMGQWGVPPKVARLVLGAHRETDAIGFARTFVKSDYASETASIMVLAGGVGVGKTVASAWAMAHLPVNGNGAYGARRFRHISQFCELGLYGDEPKLERDTLKRCRFLVLDDVGTEHMTDAFQTQFDGLINARYEDDGATIITTNLTSDAFRDRYGQRIYDRLRGRGVWYEIAHESLRGRTA